MGNSHRTGRSARNRRDLCFQIGMLAAGLAFYLFYAFYDGVYIAVDSESYINMEVSREPVYPMLLAILRSVFSFAGETFYLQVMVVLQSILAAFAAWILARYLQRRLQLPRMLTLLIWALPLLVSLLCRFAAKRAAMYSNSILTEGICIPLYLIAFRFLLEYCLDRTAKSSIWCLTLSFLMYSTRKQMLVVLVLWALCTLAMGLAGRSGSGRVVSGRFFERGECSDPGAPYLRARKASAADRDSAAIAASGPERSLPRRLLRALLASVLGAACVLLLSTALDMGYNYVVRGKATRHTSDSRFLTTMTFYTAEPEDAQYIEDEEIRELFLEIYEICDENGYLMNSAGEGWLNRVTHFGDHYDNIQIDTMWSMICSYVSDTYGDLDSLELNERADDIMNRINAAVLPHNLGKLAGCFVDNLLSGLVTTVAQRKSILIGYTVFVYLLYLAMLAVCVVRAGRKTPQKDASAQITQERFTWISLTAALAALCILVNVGVVSLVIFAQTRYTIYNMPLFYIGLLLMAYALLQGRREQDSGSPDSGGGCQSPGSP